jgi:hypothetical protein
MKDLYDFETSSALKGYEETYEVPPIEYCVNCCNFSCDCEKMIP